MARIRTIKPEFWEDEAVGLLSREARLLFLATWNLADDEGILRWSAAFVKANVFMYDDDINGNEVQAAMKELVDAGLIFPYLGGRARQTMALVVHFLRHQRINRPQPSKHLAPSLQNTDVQQMYARRDGWVCYLCNEPIQHEPGSAHLYMRLSLDHVQARSRGGGDHPSNIRATHQGCNAGKGDRPLPDTVKDPVIDVLPDTLPVSVNGSVNDSVNDSLLEGKGKEGEGKGLEVDGAAKTATRRAQALTGGFTEKVPMSRYPAVLGIVRKAIDAGKDDDDIAAALARIAAEGRSLTVETLRIELEGQPALGSGRKRAGDTILRAAWEKGS